MDEYWPVTRAKYQQVNLDISPSDSDLLLELGKQGFSDKTLVTKYPSHLHIDIVESHQSAGYGKSMISFLLSELKDAGSLGVHLHMSASNDRARAFYKKFGFNEIFEDTNECIMGLIF